MPSPFPCSPVIRECSWKKTQIEKKKKKKKRNKNLEYQNLEQQKSSTIKPETNKNRKI